MSAPGVSVAGDVDALHLLPGHVEVHVASLRPGARLRCARRHLLGGPAVAVVGEVMAAGEAVGREERTLSGRARLAIEDADPLGGGVEVADVPSVARDREPELEVDLAARDELRHSGAQVLQPDAGLEEDEVTAVRAQGAELRAGGDAGGRAGLPVAKEEVGGVVRIAVDEVGRLRCEEDQVPVGAQRQRLAGAVAPLLAVTDAVALRAPAQRQKR